MQVEESFEQLVHDKFLMHFLQSTLVDGPIQVSTHVLEDQVYIST